jgi:hypothetical protein
MKPPPDWIQVILYVVTSLVAVWLGIRLAWWLGGLTI